jgi:hypothetical protein
MNVHEVENEPGAIDEHIAAFAKAFYIGQIRLYQHVLSLEKVVEMLLPTNNPFLLPAFNYAGP